MRVPLAVTRGRTGDATLSPSESCELAGMSLLSAMMVGVLEVKLFLGARRSDCGVAAYWLRRRCYRNKVSMFHLRCPCEEDARLLRRGCEGAVIARPAQTLSSGR